MSQGVNNGNLLSSWKEIAAYLKCTVRSCIRWEEKSGLPVHRSASLPGARVYAFKTELDEWLSRQPSRPADKKGPFARPSWRRLALIALPAAAAGLAAFLFLKPGPPKPEPFRTDELSIITSETAGPGRLRAWKPAEAGGYETVWAIASSPKNTVRHTTIASGDIDGDGHPELAAPTAVKNTFYKGEGKSVLFGIFINFYKDGIDGIWKTTFYSRGDYVWEESDHARNEIVVENLDFDPAAEIILKTASALAVLKYDRQAEEIHLVSNLYAFLEGKSLLLRSVAVADGPTRGSKRLILSANEFDRASGRVDLEAGWILFLEQTDEGWAIVKSVPVNAALSDFALRVGDVSGRGEPAVYTVGDRRSGDGFESYLLGWDLEGTKTVDAAIPRSWKAAPSRSVLGVRDVTFDLGEDIFVCLKPKRLLLYSWSDGSLELKTDQEIETPGAVVNAIGFGDVDADNYLEVVLGGGVNPEDPDRRMRMFYLEIIVYSSTQSKFLPEWKCVGSDPDDREAGWIIVRTEPRPPAD